MVHPMKLSGSAQVLTSGDDAATQTLMTLAQESSILGSKWWRLLYLAAMVGLSILVPRFDEPPPCSCVGTE
jgi:hypothetical protein